MDAMPRPRPPHLQRQVTQHGRAVWYVRIGKGPRTRLRSSYGTPEFDREYVSAVIGQPMNAHAKPGTGTGTLEWLWDQYRQTPHWSILKPATRRQRENLMRHVLVTAGREPFTAINRKSILAGRDARAATPSRARHFLDVTRRLFRWALEAGHIKVDPTVGVKNLPRKKGAGFAAWDENDVEAYQRHWPIGTRQRVWLDVLLYTGLRRADAALIGRQHVRNGVATIRLEKGDETVVVTLPILAVLQKTLDAGPTGDLAWICGEQGKPFVKESFGNAFAEAGRAAGVRKSAHGVRKIAATTAALNGATVKELEAIFGWQGGRMAALYTEAADRVRLAMTAMTKLDASRTSPPSPGVQVRATNDISE